MPVFVVTASDLTPEQHYELEEELLALPGVDAFYPGEGGQDTQVTASVDALSRAVAVIYGWQAQHGPDSTQIQVVCPDGQARILVEHPPGEVVSFLALCEGAPASGRA